ncbi:uncharacterized protein LOC127379198 isoform X8 [Scomber scombrus]|uniref:Uncharacterized protein LOC127379198 isoform X8 n=1 Tax=Scomber scombrus TaxID=13677 RepID=A0AAV1P9L4_SCOSC
MAATGLQTTKGLYFTFTLLGLVCLASSLMTKDELERIKEIVHGIQENIDKNEAMKESTMADYEKLENQSLNIIVKVVERLKKMEIELLVDIPSPDGFLETFKGYLEKAKTFLKRRSEVQAAEHEEVYRRNRELEGFIEFHEGKQAEL